VLKLLRKVTSIKRGAHVFTSEPRNHEFVIFASERNLRSWIEGFSFEFSSAFCGASCSCILRYLVLVFAEFFLTSLQGWKLFMLRNTCCKHFYARQPSRFLLMSLSQLISIKFRVFQSHAGEPLLEKNLRSNPPTDGNDFFLESRTIHESVKEHDGWVNLEFLIFHSAFVICRGSPNSSAFNWTFSWNFAAFENSSEKSQVGKNIKSLFSPCLVIQNSSTLNFISLNAHEAKALPPGSLLSFANSTLKKLYRNDDSDVFLGEKVL
jgi:hypothetical protein